MAASAASLNSCANLDTLGSYDGSGLQDSDYGKSAVGTFMIQNELDENAQPPRTQVLMNCTYWVKSRKNGATGSRYCDFGGAGDK